ncbi:benzoate/H(+) symporter BenE family transporter [Oceanospirillum beijerinckii]|uniref:benzoate/H(+) symporter BenE family transporter n=1 Tax=Oceanospirillum beijerinckii TaxID=64976 RepID=UPI0004017A40|nr:benzoate/H(+) symporter BenE family transporter [Oceanospirillum beijerinckii]
MKYIPALSHTVTGFVVVLVGYASSAAIIFQAAESAGATATELTSWLWALGVGMGLSSIGLSLYYRQPVLTAWSTPGAALLVTSLSGLSMSEAIGAFLACSLLITVCGISGWFDRLISLLPPALAAAMLAGVLFPFGLQAFGALQYQLELAGLMLLCYLLLKNSLPRYAIPITLLAGLGLASLQGQFDSSGIEWQLAMPVFMMPSFSLNTLIGVAIPLFVVTMASQNMPGLAVLRAHGYQAPASPLISWTGITGLLLAPFGGFAFNLSAITAAICMSEEADPDRNKRYLASIWAGIFYMLAGLFAATVASLLLVLPKTLIMVIAGLALLTTIGNSLVSALAEESAHESALITFAITASGLSLWGIGSAFWGLVVGLGVYYLRHYEQRTTLFTAK